MDSSISEADIMAYLDGECSAELAAQIEADERLMSEISSLREMRGLFAGALYRRECPSSDTLLEYTAGLLNQEETKLIAAHLEGCDLCQPEVGQLQKELDPGISYDQPINWIKRLRESGREIIEAILRPMPSEAPQLRGNEEEIEVFDAGPYQISILKRPPLIAEMGWTIEGQIFDPEDPFWESEHHFNLYKNGQKIASQTINTYGYFSIDELAAGSYQGEFLIEDQHILVEIKIN